MNIDRIWIAIITHQGEVFHTINNLPFTYTISGNTLITSSTNYPIAKMNFIKAMEFAPLTGPGQLNQAVRGPAYVYAILTDARITGQ